MQIQQLSSAGFRVPRKPGKGPELGRSRRRRGASTVAQGGRGSGERRCRCSPETPRPLPERETETPACEAKTPSFLAGMNAFSYLYAPMFDLIRLYFQPKARSECLINDRIQGCFWRKNTYFSIINAYFSPKKASFPAEKMPKTAEPHKMQKYRLRNPPNFSDPESRQNS